MSETMGVVLLGAAMFHAQAWSEGIANHPRTQFIGVWDHETARGQAIAQRFQTQFEPDLMALLQSRDVQAVAICAEHDQHAPLSVSAAQAGKHVICEKPMATTLEDCDRMIAAFRAAGVQYFQSFQMRFDPANVAVRDRIHGGELGRVSVAYKRHSHGYDFSQWATDAPPWFLDPCQGGVLADVGIHALDWLRWVFGEPLRVTASCSHRLGFAVPDTIVATYECPDHVLCVVHASWAEKTAMVSTEILGDGGALYQFHSDPSSAHTPRHLSHPLLIHRTGEPEWVVPDVTQLFPRVHAHMVQVCLDCLLAGTPPLVSAADGRRAVELMLAAQRAASEGRSVDIPVLRKNLVRPR